MDLSISLCKSILFRPWQFNTPVVRHTHTHGRKLLSLPGESTLSSLGNDLYLRYHPLLPSLPFNFLTHADNLHLLIGVVTGSCAKEETFDFVLFNLVLIQEALSCF